MTGVPANSCEVARERVRNRCAATLKADDAERLRRVVALDDFVGHAAQGARHVIGAHELTLRKKRQAARACLAFVRTAHQSPVVRASRDSLHDRLTLPGGAEKSCGVGGARPS